MVLWCAFAVCRCLFRIFPRALFPLRRTPTSPTALWLSLRRCFRCADAVLQIGFQAAAFAPSQALAFLGEADRSARTPAITQRATASFSPRSVLQADFLLRGIHITRFISSLFYSLASGFHVFQLLFLLLCPRAPENDDRQFPETPGFPTVLSLRWISSRFSFHSRFFLSRPPCEFPTESLIIFEAKSLR